MTLTKEDLRQFYGSEVFYRHPLMRKYVYTEGVQFVAEKGGAYWLIDAILSWQSDKKVRSHEFQRWTLTVTGSCASLKAEDGNCHNIVEQIIAYTDFPLPEISFYLTNNTLLLPSEW